MPYYNKDPKRDPNFDNHPYKGEARHPGSAKLTPSRATCAGEFQEAPGVLFGVQGGKLKV